MRASESLLLADATPTVSPAIGQGCNASLEDVLIFTQLLEHYNYDWAKALPAFSEQRLPDAHALQDLSNLFIPCTKGLVLEFFVQLPVDRLLQRWLPK